MCAEKTGEEKREIVIYLPNCKVEGSVDLPHGCKSLSDFVTLNPAKQFIGVVDATVSAIRAHETWKYEVKKINIRKDYIVTIFSRGGMKPIEGK